MFMLNVKMNYLCSAPEAGCWAVAASLLVENSPETLNQVRVRYEMTLTGGGARGLSRQRAARARALFFT